MSKYIGRKISVGLGKETVRGTAVSPTYWVPTTSVEHYDKVEVAKAEGGFGTIHGSNDSVVVKNFSEGGFGGNIYDKSFGLVLLSLFGSVSSVAKSAPNATVYDHTFSVAEASNHQSLTIGLDEGNGDTQYAMSVIDSLEISYEVGKLIEYKASFMGKKGASGTLTPAFISTESFFAPQDLTMKMASAVSGLSGASASSIRSFKITIKKNVEADTVLGNLEPRDFVNKDFTVEGEFTQVFEAQTTQNLAIAGTKQAIGLTLTNARSTIGTSANPGLAITLAQVVFEELSRDTKLGDLVMQTFKFSGEYKLSETSMVSAVLTNLVTSY